MSATPHTPVPQGLDGPLPMTLPRLAEKKRQGEAIVMVTAYDYPSATVAEAAGVDLVLVGDSAANVVLGYDRTDLVSMEEMIVLGKAVRRGLRTPLMIGDMPMGSYEASDELAVTMAQRLIKEKRDLLIVVEMHPDVWASASTTRTSAQELLDELELMPIPLQGQSDALGDHATVHIQQPERV